MMKKILVTGSAGFIGSNLVDKLLLENFFVVGVDNFNKYYDPKIKEANLKKVKGNKNFKLYRSDILDLDSLKKIFVENKLDTVVHLAARAGVRSSITDPMLYAQNNVLGTVNLLKLSVDNKVRQFIFGSSSSVYGNSTTVPFEEENLCQDIVSPYGASKRAAEFFVESFNKSFGLKSIILRFFTVYGQRGRIDMVPYIFTSKIMKGASITQYGDGTSSRDYTYIDDIVDGIMRALVWKGDFEIINLGSDNPVKLSDFIHKLEAVLGKRAKISFGSWQMGDVERTWANIVKANKVLGWKPQISLEKGLARYVTWFKSNKKLL